MRLWQKLFLISLTLVLFAIDLTALLLLNETHHRSVEALTEQGTAQNAFYVGVMRTNLAYARLATSSSNFGEQETLALLRRVMRSQTASSPVGLSLYDTTGRRISIGALPEEYEDGVLTAVRQNGGYYTEIVDYDGKSFLLCAAGAEFENKSYVLVSSSNVTPTFAARQKQLDFLSKAGIISAICAAGLLLLAVLLLLRPLRHITDATREIAQGNYRKRLPEGGSDELSKLSEDMNAMAASIERNVTRLEDLADSRRLFIANLAHEMKTPLTSILGYADILRIKRVVDDAQRQEYAGVIVEEADRLRALSSKLMELQTLGVAELEFEEIPIADLFEELKLSLSPLLRERGLTLSVACSDNILFIDKQLFKSLLYNLCDNAVKASKRGSTIYLSAGRTKDGGFAISIRDEGYGIPEKELSRITEPFYMVDKSRSRQAGGAGLGLALCERIADLHGCRLHFESTVGIGTTATILFDEEGGTER